jgi:energy-coupling factor transport system ATP-binding protein
VDSNQIILQLKDINFQYTDSQSKIISNLNLEVLTGEFIVITGRSGSGKSTLAFILSGFIPHLIGGVYEGEVRYQGIETQTLTLGEISQLVGLVHQDPENQIVTSNVLEELAFGAENLNLSKEEIMERIQFSVSATNLGKLITRGTNELSGGEKQRVAIASLLAMGGSILILDEPTSYLDFVNRTKVLKTLQKLNSSQNMTIIVIDHQPEIYKDLLTRLVVLDKGTIVGDYKKDEIDHATYQIPLETLGKIRKLPVIKSKDYILETIEYNVFIKNRKILSKISTKIKPGLIYGIIGRNGSGKTTFGNSLLNLNVKKGAIFIMGENSTKKPPYELAKDCGLIFQNPNHQIFEQTVEKELLFAPVNLQLDSKISEKKINRLLLDSSLKKYQNSPPFGLSFGEKRRLNVISVDIYSPSILIMDEPFIGQDRNNFEFILKILQIRKENGLTSIIISHRQELYYLVDRLLVFDQGNLIGEGIPKDLLPIIQKKQLYPLSLEV